MTETIVDNKNIKRTVNSPLTVDSAENIPQTPEMIAELPDTADTPDSKTKIPKILNKISTDLIRRKPISKKSINTVTYKKRTEIEKRTRTPDTKDTPDMDVDTPDTPDTPAFKIKVKETKNTPESSGFQFSGSGDDASYTEVDNGSFRPFHFISNPLSNVTEKVGVVQVQWKPLNKNTSRIRIHGARMDTDYEAKTAEIEGDNRNMIGEETKISLDKENAKHFKNSSFDHTMLDYFFNQYNKKSKIVNN